MFEWQTERNAKKGSIKEGPARGTNHRTEIRLREGKWHPMERGPSRAQRSAVTWRCSLLLPKDHCKDEEDHKVGREQMRHARGYRSADWMPGIRENRIEYLLRVAERKGRWRKGRQTATPMGRS